MAHEGRIDGLPDRKGRYRVFPVQTVPDWAQGEVGDVATRGESVRWVRMADGWHRVDTLSMVSEVEEAERTDIMNGSGDVVMSWGGADKVVGVTITVASLSPATDPEVGSEGAIMPHIMNGHPFRASNHTEADGWTCAACGAVTMDAELFKELGCYAL